MTVTRQKVRISKWVFQENKARQIFRKKEHFLPPDFLPPDTPRRLEVYHVKLGWL